jgi:hypothetical protein
MPSQQADIAETIAALKRALKLQSDGQKSQSHPQDLKEYRLLTFLRIQRPPPSPSPRPQTEVISSSKAPNMYMKVLSRSCVDQMFTNKYVGRLTPVPRESNPNLTRGTRRLSTLAIHDSYSNATLADTTSMETNLTTAKVTRRRTKMLLMRMPMLESDSKVCVCTWLSEQYR